MKALRRSHTSTSSGNSSSPLPSSTSLPSSSSSTSPPSSNSSSFSSSSSSSSSPSSWIHLRSVLFVANLSSPSSVTSSDRRRKSPWSRRKRKWPLTLHQWRSLSTPEGKLRDGGVGFLKRVRSRGVDPSIRAEVWLFLLGVYDLNSTSEEREAVNTQKRKEYEKLQRRCKMLLKRGNGSTDDLEEEADDQCVRFMDDYKTPGPMTNQDVVSAVNTDSSDTDSCEDNEDVQLLPSLVYSDEKKPGEENSNNNNSCGETSSPSPEIQVEVTLHEDFSTWQRIIRLDALRADSDWATYSSSSTAITETLHTNKQTNKQTMVETLLPSRFQSHLQKLDPKRRLLASTIASHKTLLFAFLWIAAFASVFLWQRSSYIGGYVVGPVAGGRFTVFGKAKPLRPVPRLRPAVFDLKEFGGVGDGVTVNTEAFERAVVEISKLGGGGGGQLNVPPGRWLTAPFNLTSRMTLFLAEDCEILGVEDEKFWTLMPPLPSYGYGRERPGPRYGSLIHGQNLKDVVITGHNGTINGQGQSWWKKHQRRLLNNTRGPLVQIMWSSDIVIANVTLRDSPFWTLHPYDCKNVTIRNVTILAPVTGAPNTDGIDPDSCEDMVIEDCYISTGDDAIAIKSGWDQFGIAYGRPSTNILIRNLIVRSVISAGVSIGSEMSGGISNVTIENLLIWNSRRGVRIKTAQGRGGYIKNITYKNVTLDNVRVGIVIKTDYNEHADDNYDRKAYPTLSGFSFSGIHGQGVRVPVRIHGSEQIPVRNVTFRDMSVGLTYKKKHIFQCSFVKGRVIGSIFPRPCENFDVYDEEGRLVKPATESTVPDIDYDI